MKPYRIFLLVAAILALLSCTEYDFDNPADSGNTLSPVDSLSIEILLLSSVKVSWVHDGFTEYYRVDRKINSSNWQEEYKLLDESTRSITDTGLTPNEQISYRVYAIADENISNPTSDDVTISFSAPYNLEIAQTSSSSCLLTWEYKALGGEVGFKIERKAGSGSWSPIADVSISTLSYDDEGLETGVQYTYQVYAYSPNYAGNAIEVSIELNAIPTEGLVAYYPLNGTGDDASGNGHHGESHNAVPVMDRFGVTNGAMSFNGQSQYITTDLALQYSTDDSFTWSVWYKSEDVLDESSNLIAIGFENSDDGEVTVGVWNSQHPSYANRAEATSRCDSYSSHGGVHTVYGNDEIVGDGQWHHVVWIRDRSNMEYMFYIDGNLELTLTDNNDNLINGASQTLGIGCQSHNSSWDKFFNGLIDDIRIYNNAISESEVLSLYHENGWE